MVLKIDDVCPPLISEPSATEIPLSRNFLIGIIPLPTFKLELGQCTAITLFFFINSSSSSVEKLQ
ncbi:hypothetical protein D3C75_1132650 [compost metagenome]